MREKLHVIRLGQRGEGMAEGARGPVFVPYALPGDTIIADVEGERGRLVEILEPSADRIAAFCPHYGICGGCAVQALAPGAYAEWKLGLVADALRHAKLEPRVGALVDAHGEGRRRATFHARTRAKEVRVGFMRARAHEVVDLDSCPILAPGMTGALDAAHALAEVLGGPLDISITATRTGLDIDIKGHGPLTAEETERLLAIAKKQDLARISNDRLCVIERRAPLLKMGEADVLPPPGAFLQATEAGEAALAEKVCEALAQAKHIADLFAGIGTFTLRLAKTARVHAIDNDVAALAALTKAAANTIGLKPVTSEVRDLFRRPLVREELARYDAVLFDPPRAGAQAQAQALAASDIPLIVAVSCNPQSFARDAALLAAAGYEIESVTPFDQFRHSPHVESVGILRRNPKKLRRPLL